MGVFTFVLRNSGDEWTAKQHSGDIEASAPSTFELQRKLVQSSLAADSSGAVQSSFSLVSPSSAVFQVHLPFYITFIGNETLGFILFLISAFQFSEFYDFTFIY